MKCKKIVAATVCLVNATSMMAGGLLTNTNQNAVFLRNPSRDAVIDIDGVYMNPAGIAFMNTGFHLNLSIQSAYQTRDITTTFPTLAANVNHAGEATRKYTGKVSAPVIPSFQAAYVWDKWTASAAFAIGGGGGKCNFDNGIGSFEVPYSMLIPTAVNAQFAAMGAPYKVQGYDMDMYMNGRQYYFGFQLGTTYKINDKLAVGAGLRTVFASCNYNGAISNIKVKTDAPAAVEEQLNQSTSAYNISLDTDQSGLGFTPYVSVDFMPNKHWNFAAKYEFKTRMRLKNKTKQAQYPDMAATTLAQFDEKQNKEVAEDIPGILTVGAQYSPIDPLRISAGFHWYDDTHATRYADKHKDIDRGTIEFTAGVEYDICKVVTASIGYQNTNYALSDKFMNDMSFNVSSNLIALGARVNVSDKLSIDVGYMRNFYGTKEVTTEMTSGLNKVDSYTRSNYAFAVGVNMNF